MMMNNNNTTDTTNNNGDNGDLMIGLGEILWDCLPEGKQLGGAPANFACHAAQFGFDARAVSAVGTDALGDETIAALRARGVRYLLPRVAQPTGTVQVTLDASGVPAYDIRQGVAWDNIPFTPALKQAALRCRAVCWGSLAQRAAVSRQTIRTFIASLPPRCLKIFDINLRQHFFTPEILQESMACCDILKINDEEMDVVRRLFGIPSPDVQGACHALLRRFRLQALVLTCGAEGSHVFTAQGAHTFRATPRVRVADTVGAGDSFTAAFAAALLRGKSAAEAHRIAVDVSAYVCTQHGATPLLPQELTSAVKS